LALGQIPELVLDHSQQGDSSCLGSQDPWTHANGLKPSLLKLPRFRLF
jgi:hypothetical protein